MVVYCSYVLVSVTKSATFIYSSVILKQVLFDDTLAHVHRK